MGYGTSFSSVVRRNPWSMAAMGPGRLERLISLNSLLMCSYFQNLGLLSIPVEPNAAANSNCNEGGSTSDLANKI